MKRVLDRWNHLYEEGLARDRANEAKHRNDHVKAQGSLTLADPPPPPRIDTASFECEAGKASLTVNGVATPVELAYAKLLPGTADPRTEQLMLTTYSPRTGTLTSLCLEPELSDAPRSTRGFATTEIKGYLQSPAEEIVVWDPSPHSGVFQLVHFFVPAGGRGEGAYVLSDAYGAPSNLKVGRFVLK